MQFNNSKLVYIVLFFLLIINLLFIIIKNSIYKKRYLKNSENYKNKICIELIIIILYIINVFIISRNYENNIHVWTMLILAITIIIRFMLIHLSKYWYKAKW